MIHGLHSIFQTLLLLHFKISNLKATLVSWIFFSKMKQ